MGVGPVRTEEFDEAGTMLLGCAKYGSVSRWLVHVEGDGWTGSVTPKGRSVGNADLDAIEVAWYNMNTGQIVAAGSAPTADALMLIESTGLDVELAVTASAGSVTITAVHVVG